MSELATRLVNTLERLDTRSAAVMRHAAYVALEQCGIDVRRLVGEARAAETADRKARAERSQNSYERLVARASRIPELSALVQRGPTGKVREMLAAGHTVDDISIALGEPRAFVRQVKDLDAARAAKAKLTDQRRQLPKKHWERLARIQSRGGWTAAPTKERKRQLGEGEEFVEAKVVGEQKTHRSIWAVDQIRNILSDPAYYAAQLLRDAHADMQSASKVGSLDGGGTGGNPSRKLGLTPAQERASPTYRALWGRLPAGLRPVVLNFVLGRPLAGGERALSLVEFGRAYSFAPGLGEHQARGVAQGALKTACEVLAHLSKEFDAWAKGEQRKVYREMGALDVAVRIRDVGIGELAAVRTENVVMVMLCERIKVERWIVRRCVRKAIRAAQDAKAQAVHAMASAS